MALPQKQFACQQCSMLALNDEMLVDWSHCLLLPVLACLLGEHRITGGGWEAAFTHWRARLQVYQAISAYASRLDNIVELYSTVRLPQLPGLPPIDPIVTTATLKHYFEAIGGSTVRITFEDTEVKSTGTSSYSGTCSNLQQGTKGGHHGHESTAPSAALSYQQKKSTAVGVQLFQLSSLLQVGRMEFWDASPRSPSPSCQRASARLALPGPPHSRSCTWTTKCASPVAPGESCVPSCAHEAWAAPNVTLP